MAVPYPAILPLAAPLRNQFCLTRRSVQKKETKSDLFVFFAINHWIDKVALQFMQVPRDRNSDIADGLTFAILFFHPGNLWHFLIQCLTHTQPHTRRTRNATDPQKNATPANTTNQLRRFRLLIRWILTALSPKLGCTDVLVFIVIDNYSHWK